MTLHVIRLELAREKDFPQGSSEHGYEFVAPLDATGQFDADEWKSQRKFCTVRRFWPGQEDETGHLIHGRGGRWAFSYDPTTDADDEPIFRFDRHVMRLGEYVSVTEHDGRQHTFRIVGLRLAA
ncbi:hypothetical protein [Ferrovibrio sp.]|uniref:hypothetical protein n=1 Tax=Ferrovibrio sp. TaxID=1917215 RepID=UPI001B5B3F38|nr:hypothetical protein [Ferrovibrio sp.]MBP7063681.1 hypothetical protein [Ferrovibrio sp.]